MSRQVFPPKTEPELRDYQGFSGDGGNRTRGRFPPNVDPLEIPCSFCLAAPGEYCRSVLEPREMAGVHAVRQLDADARTRVAS